MEHNPSILAYMTVKIEEDGIREQTEDLDTQIAGKEAKTSRAPHHIVEKSATEEETTTKVEEVSVEETPVEVEESKEKPVAEETPSETEVASEEKVEE
jgi:hypothetical protein